MGICNLGGRARTHHLHAIMIVPKWGQAYSDVCANKTHMLLVNLMDSNGTAVVSICVIWTDDGCRGGIRFDRTTLWLWWLVDYFFLIYLIPAIDFYSFIKLMLYIRCWHSDDMMKTFSTPCLCTQTCKHSAPYSRTNQQHHRDVSNRQSDDVPSCCCSTWWPLSGQYRRETSTPCLLFDGLKCMHKFWRGKYVPNKGAMAKNNTHNKQTDTFFSLSLFPSLSILIVINIPTTILALVQCSITLHTFIKRHASCYCYILIFF